MGAQSSWEEVVLRIVLGGRQIILAVKNGMGSQDLDTCTCLSKGGLRPGSRKYTEVKAGIMLGSGTWRESESKGKSSQGQIVYMHFASSGKALEFYRVQES